MIVGGCFIGSGAFWEVDCEEFFRVSQIAVETRFLCMAFNASLEGGFEMTRRLSARG